MMERAKYIISFQRPPVVSTFFGFLRLFFVIFCKKVLKTVPRSTKKHGCKKASKGKKIVDVGEKVEAKTHQTT